MALTGTFVADFASFQDAVAQAEVSLKGFESGAGKVETSLNKVADSLSGAKVIQQATLMSEAVDRIGGVSKLTESELARVGSVAAEASAKMVAMGIDVPPGIAKIATEANSTTGEFTRMRELVTGLAGAFGIAFSIGAVVNFGREVLAAGSGIEKMAAQTGLTNEQVQRFQHIAGQTGTDVTALVGAVQNLEQRLGDDSSGAAGAMAKLGINLEAFKRLSPYDQMLTLSDALRGVTDITVRSSLEAAIFGKTWKEVGPAVVSNMRDIGDEAPLMSDATIKATADAEKALKGFGETLLVWGGNIVLSIEESRKAQRDFMDDEFRTKVEQQKKDLDDLQKTFAAIPPVVTTAGKSVDGLGQSAAYLSATEKLLTADVNASIDAHKGEAEATKKADEATQKYLDDIIARYKEAEAAQTKAFTTESGQLAALTAAHVEYEKAVNAASHDTLTAQIADASAAADAKIAAMQKAKTYTVAAEVEIRAAADQTAANLVQKSLEADVNSREHYQLLADQARIAYDFATAHADSYTADWIQKLRDSATAAQLTADSWGTSFDGALDAISTKVKAETLSWSQAMDLVDQGLGTMTGTVANAPLTAESKAATQKAWDTDTYFGPVIGGTRENPRGSGPDWAALGYRALGGAVSAGQPYMVGERGPELFVPAGNGSILPNGGGGTTIIQLVVDGQVLAAVVNAQNTRAMKQGRKWPSA